MDTTTNTAKNKEHYIAVWETFWDECVKRAEKNLKAEGVEPDEGNLRDEATEIFEETADAAQIVGSYIVYHKENALKDWRVNTEGITLTEKDKEVTRILEALYL